MYSTVVGILPKEPNTEEGEASLENRIGAAAVVVQVSPTSSPELTLYHLGGKSYPEVLSLHIYSLGPSHST
jgi:hypothetical protein